MRSQKARAQSGATLVETLAVLGIVAVLVAIGTSVIASAKKKGKETVCVSNMRQVQLAVAMYQNDWDGSGQYGSTATMGLPPSFLTASMPSLRKTKFICSGESFDLPFNTRFPYIYMGSGNQNPTWQDYASAYRGASILLIDMHHNPRSLFQLNFHEKRLGLGVTVDGALVRRFDNGDWTFKPWWNGDTSLLGR